MNRFSKKAILLSSLVVPFAFGAATASAAQITEWEYQVNNSFTDAQFTDADSGVAVAEDTRIYWGGESESVQSELTIEGKISDPPLLETNGDAVAGGQFVHENNQIPVDVPELQSFVLTSSLQLTAAAPASEAGTEVGPLEIEFDSFFTETLNEAPCVEGSETTCDDIFTLQNPEFGEADDDGNFSVDPTTFTIGDFNYTVFLEIVGLNDLTDDQCGAANAPATCIGFLTQEDQRNTFNTNFRITSAPVAVPEPGSLALLGLGLVGLGVASRRKKAA